MTAMRTTRRRDDAEFIVACDDRYAELGGVDVDEGLDEVDEPGGDRGVSDLMSALRRVRQGVATRRGHRTSACVVKLCAKGEGGER
jgi:hypothetical protein